MSSSDDSKLVLSFGIPASEAEKIHRAAQKRGVPVSELIRGAIYHGTNDLTDFDQIQVVTGPLSGRGRKATRFREVV